MHLLLALLLQTAPASTPVQQQRAVVEKGLDEFDANVTQLSGFIQTRFSADSDVPRTGMAVMSDDADADGLHPIIVANVIEGSPADIAGVRPGDRVLRVGPRRIEHETAQAFRLITDGKAGPLVLVLLREGSELTVTVDRTPLACLKRSSAHIDQKQWLARMAELRRISGMVRSELDDETATPAEARYRAAKDHLLQLYALFDEFSKKLSAELTDALAKECAFRIP